MKGDCKMARNNREKKATGNIEDVNETKTLEAVTGDQQQQGVDETITTPANLVSEDYPPKGYQSIYDQQPPENPAGFMEVITTAPKTEPRVCSRHYLFVGVDLTSLVSHFGAKQILKAAIAQLKIGNQNATRKILESEDRSEAELSQMSEWTPERTFTTKAQLKTKIAALNEADPDELKRMLSELGIEM